MARIMTDETSLTRRRRLLQVENRLLGKLYLVELALGGLLLLVGLFLYLTKGQFGLAILGATIVFIGFGHYIKSKQNKQEATALEAGAQGEAQTAQQLAASLDQTHYLFNDIVLRQGLRSAQIDHLVICPHGIYVVETKNWRGRIEGHGDDAYWTQVKYADSSPIRLKSPVNQVRRQADTVARVLRNAGKAPDKIVPVVAFASTKTTLQVDSPQVPVVHVASLPQAISRHRSATEYTEAEVDAWVNAIMKRI